MTKIRVLFALVILLLGSISAYAAPLTIERVSDESNELKIENPDGFDYCTSLLSSVGEESYFDPDQPDRVSISGQTDATVNFIIATSPLQIPCWGAGRINSNVWQFQPEYQLNGDEGAQAQISGRLRVQWYRALLNQGPGFTEAALSARVEIYVRGTDSQLRLIDTLNINESISRTSLGFSGYLDDWRERSFNIPTVNVGETVLFIGSIGGLAAGNLTNFLFGGMYAESRTYFSLSAAVREIVPPPPEPTPATPIPTMTAYSFVLTMLSLFLLANRHLRASARRQ